MTEASVYLVALAERIAEAYTVHTEPRAILFTGSAAEGTSDGSSDLDLIIYHDRLPTDERLAAARAILGSTDARVPPARDDDGCIEEFRLVGVDCQVAHITVAAWERDMASLLVACTPATLTEKAITGLLGGVALHGDDVIGGWQQRAERYPDELARATVAHHLRIFPLWLVPDYWESRDAAIFYHEALVDSMLNLLGMLAGLNRRYYSRFQFKRLRRFVRTLDLAPPDLADRLDELFALDPVEAAAALERLAEETVKLVEDHMPSVDTGPVRRHLGQRRRPWTPVPISDI
jgi:hypothetical protein